MDPIILASASPRRMELLEQINLSYIVSPSTVEERISDLTGTPSSKAEQLAFQKALNVAHNFEDRIVIGADTIVVLQDRILGKPKDRKEAFEMLRSLSGTEHSVITGIAVVDLSRNIKLSGSDITEVTFKNLDEEVINAYLDKGEYKDKAGSYAIQGIAAVFIESIKGSYTNVVGLPLSKLSDMLLKIGIKVL